MKISKQDYENIADILNNDESSDDDEVSKHLKQIVPGADVSDIKKLVSKERDNFLKMKYMQTDKAVDVIKKYVKETVENIPFEDLMNDLNEQTGFVEGLLNEAPEKKGFGKVVKNHAKGDETSLDFAVIEMQNGDDVFINPETSLKGYSSVQDVGVGDEVRVVYQDTPRGYLATEVEADSGFKDQVMNRKKEAKKASIAMNNFAKKLTNDNPTDIGPIMGDMATVMDYLSRGQKAQALNVLKAIKFKIEGM